MMYLDPLQPLQQLEKREERNKCERERVREGMERDPLEGIHVIKIHSCLAFLLFRKGTQLFDQAL